MLNRRLLQAAIALGGCVPVIAGLAGIVQGAGLTADHVSAALDSHLRYLSGLLLAIGLGFWSTIARIETHRGRFLLLTLIVVAGGLARLYGLLTHPLPPPAMRAAAVMELVITPALWLWQRRLSARH
jgi:hypothetical protein